MSEQKPPEDSPSNPMKEESTEVEDSYSLAIEEKPSKSDEFSSSAADDSASFKQKVVAFYKTQLYNLNYLHYNVISNLNKKKQILATNFKLLEENPLIHTLDRDARVQEDLENLRDQIQTTTSELTTLRDSTQQEFDKAAFQTALTQIRSCQKQANKYGIDELKIPIKNLLRSLRTSIQIERKLCKFQYQNSENLPEKDITRLYLSLTKKQTQIASKIKTIQDPILLHPTVKDHLEFQLKIFEDFYQNSNLPKPTASFIDQIKFFWFNALDFIKIQKSFVLLYYYLNRGMKYENLPKAWTFLQKAESLISSQPTTCYLDMQRNWTRKEELTKELISALNDKTQASIAGSRDLLEEFNYEQAEQILIQTKEEMVTYRMEKLIEQLDTSLAVVSSNKTLYEKNKMVQVLFDTNDFLQAKKEMSLIKEMLGEIDNALISTSLLTEIENLENQISTEYTKGQEGLQAQLHLVKTQVIEDLDFEKARKKLQKLRETGESQEYSEYLTEHQAYLEEFNFNFHVKDEVSAIEVEIKEERYGTGSTIITNLVNAIASNHQEIYPKVTQLFEDINKKLNEAIQKEGDRVQSNIQATEVVIHEELDISRAESLLNEIVNRINHTKLDQMKEKLAPISLLIQENKAIHEKFQRIQLIFQDGDLNDAQSQIEELLRFIVNNMKSNDPYFKEPLKNHIISFQEQIVASLQDGVESLQADFDAIDDKIQDTLNFGTIQNLLANYKIRAIRLGLEDIKSEIEVKLLQVIDNSSIMENKRELLQKYENQQNLVETLAEIQTFGESAATQTNLFPHVKNDIESFLANVSKDSTDRTDQTENALSNIIDTQINLLLFQEAEKSLIELLETSQSLAVTTVKNKIEGHLGICASHKGLLANVLEVEDLLASNKIMEARHNIGAIVTSIHEYKGVIITQMRDKVEAVRKTVEDQRESEIQRIRTELETSVRKIEAKQAKEIYSSLLSHLDLAHYLESTELITEIEGLIQLSKLQLDPEFLQKFEHIDKKKQKTSIESQKIVKTFSIDEIAAQSDLSEQTKIFTIKQSDYDFLMEKEDAQEFNTLAEKRSYKRKKNLIKRSKKVRPPETNENLNDGLRSSVTRLRLQVYDQQVNRPLFNKNLRKCPHCNADQPEDQAYFCFFCGKSMNE